MNQTARSTTSARPRNRSERRAQSRGPALCNIAAATMLVSCAIEEARKRGFMSRRDTEGMRQSEYNDYVDLCAREWGVVNWEPDLT